VPKAGKSARRAVASFDFQADSVYGCSAGRTAASQAAWVPARRVVRGGSWNNNDNNARAVYRNRNNPNNRNNNNGFRVAAAVHVLPSLLRPVHPVCPASGTSHQWCPLPTMRAEVKVVALRRSIEEQRRPVWSARARLRTARRAHIENRARPGSASGPGASALYAPRVCLIQPPSSLPTSATISLTCRYCPAVSQPHWWTSRK